MVTVRTHLWFGNNRAHEAAEFYARHVPDSHVDRILDAPQGVPGVEPGMPFIVEFTVGGLPYTAINAGPVFHLDEAFSFFVEVDTQEEIDRLWDVLTSDGGEPSQCGWCKDKFGVSWQVVPKRLAELCGDYSTEANLRAMNAMLTMRKLDVAALEAAYDGQEVPSPAS